MSAFFLQVLPKRKEQRQFGFWSTIAKLFAKKLRTAASSAAVVIDTREEGIAIARMSLKTGYSLKNASQTFKLVIMIMAV